MNRTLISVCLCLAGTICTQAQNQDNKSTQLERTENVFRQAGIASWYGAEFEGRPTASGELFNTRLLTAAHPKLPFGTILRVTNTQNGKSVLVRVNDRGPFVAARILDVSRAAAEKLDMIVTGTAPVDIESVGETPGTERLTVSDSASTEELAPPPASLISMPTNSEIAKAKPFHLLPAAPSADSGKKYRLQLGSYKIASNAAEAFDRLKAAGLNPSYERNGELYRIVLAFVEATQIARLTETLSAAGFSEALVREER